MSISPVSAEPDPAAALRAGLWMLGSVVSFSLTAVAGREMARELDTFEIMLYRSVVGLIIVCIVAGATGRLGQITFRSPHLHLMRNIVHFIGQNLWLFALTAIPLAQVFALEFTAPLWVLVLSPLLLGERMTRMRVLAALLGFVGILIVARPAPDTVTIGTLAAASAAIAFALTVICTKLLTRTEGLVCILFWMTAMQLVLGLLSAGFDGQIALPSKAIWPWLLAISVGGLTAQLCVTKALSIAPATVVAPVDFVRLPVIAVVGLLFYGEAVDLLVILGALIIFSANYLNLWSETRKKP